MNRTIATVLILVASATVLVSTAGAPVGQTADRVGDHLVVRPADGPHGAYATVTSAGAVELVVADENPAVPMTGVSDERVTPIDRVLTVRYTGKASAEVWITDDADDVRFFRGGDPTDTVDSRAERVALGPGDSMQVGVIVDTTGNDDVSAHDGFVLHAELADATTPRPTERPVQTPATEEPTGSPACTDATDRPTTATRENSTAPSNRPLSAFGVTLGGTLLVLAGLALLVTTRRHWPFDGGDG